MLSFFFLTSSAVPFCFLMYGFYGLLIGEGWVGGVGGVRGEGGVSGE